MLTEITLKKPYNLIEKEILSYSFFAPAYRIVRQGENFLLHYIQGSKKPLWGGALGILHEGTAAY